MYTYTYTYMYMYSLEVGVSGCVMWCFAEAKPMSRCIMFGESINRTQKTVAGRLHCSPCNDSLVLLLYWSSFHWERHRRELLLVHLLVLVTPADSCRFGGSLAVSVGLGSHCWWAFSNFLNWRDCWYPDNEDWNPTENYLDTGPHPLVLFTFFLPYRWLVG